VSEFSLPLNFDPDRDALLRLTAEGAAVGDVGPMPLEWDAASEKAGGGDFLTWVKELRLRTGREEDEDRLGLAVSALLHEEVCQALEAREGRWVVHADADSGAGLVPWEAWLGYGSGPAITSGSRPLVRWLPGETGSPVRMRRSRLLILVGSTQQRPGVQDPSRDLAGEIRAIEKAAAGFSAVVTAAAGGVVPGFGTQRGVRGFKDLTELGQLLGEGFHVVHYVGHSNEQGLSGAVGLTFGEQVGAVTAEELTTALAGTCTRLMVLNACNVPDAMARVLAPCADHLVAMGARVTPKQTAAWAGAFYAELFEKACPVSEAVAAARRAFGDRPWIPGHWARTLDDQPLMSPAQFALERHRAGVVTEHGPYLGALGDRAPNEDAIGELTVELSLGAPGKLSPTEGPWTVAGLVHRCREFNPTGPAGFVLKAHPGGGKTTSLRQLARGLARDRGWVPYYASLADWPRSKGKLEPFWEVVKEDLVPALRTEASSGRLVLLLDGLDECRDAGAVNHFLAHDLPEGDGVTIVATRIVFPRAALPSDFGVEARLDPLSPTQQLELLQKWFKALDVESPEQQADLLRTHMQGSSFLRELAGTPLYLTLAALLWGDPDEGDPKEQAHELYEQCLNFLLRAKHKNEGQEDNQPEAPPIALSKDLLELIALRGIQLDQPWVKVGDTEDLLALSDTEDPFHGAFAHRLAKLGEKVEGWSAGDLELEDLFTRIQDRTGVIDSSKGLDKWRFPHKTFREALASLALRDLYRRGKFEGLKTFLQAVFDKWGNGEEDLLSAWSEVVAITTGWIKSEDKDAWVRWLHGIHPRLALRALAFGSGVSPETIVAVLGLGADRKERWEVYGRVIEVEEEPLPRLEVIEGLVGALKQLDGEGAFEGGPVPDWAFLDFQLRELAREDGSMADAVELARNRVLDAVDERAQPKPDELREAFSKVPGHPEQDLWVRVPEGSFTIGSPEDEQGRFHTELQAQVSLPGFWIGATTITRGQYRLFDPGKHYDRRGTPNLPATEVSWFESSLFCRWLERWREYLPVEAPGREFQLPSEAMWEYACRDGGRATRAYVSGEEEVDLARVGWYSGNVESGLRPVATAPESSPSYELWDMHGNVWEWCQEWYVDWHRNGHDPRSEGDALPDAGRVLRGGAFWCDAPLCRSAVRVHRHPAVAANSQGFRVVLAPRPPTD
jgi:formylglycine-generating enzyme required for sulfatase activity